MQNKHIKFLLVQANPGRNRKMCPIPAVTLLWHFFSAGTCNTRITFRQMFSGNISGHCCSISASAFSRLSKNLFDGEEWTWFVFRTWKFFRILLDRRHGAVSKIVQKITAINTVAKFFCYPAPRNGNPLTPLPSHGFEMVWQIQNSFAVHLKSLKTP